jgi:Ammonium Transporter Family
MSHDETTTIFQQCVGTLNENITDVTLLQCISDTFEQTLEDHIERSFPRSILLMFAASLIFFMQAGFAMICAGAVRKKNVQNTMLKNLLDACGACLSFYCTVSQSSFCTVPLV